MEPEAEDRRGALNLITRYMNEGEDLFEDGEYEEALSRWLKVLEIDPANEVAMQNMARAHEKLMGSPFKKVVAKAKPKAPPSVARKTPTSKAPEARDTKPISRQAVQAKASAAKKPEKPMSNQLKRYLKRGVDFFNTKEYDRAILEWAKVIREDPDHETTLRYIRKARERLTKDESEEEVARREELAERLETHGDEYMGDSEYRMAINQYVQALTYRPDSGPLFEKIQDAHAKLKQAGEKRRDTPGTPRSLRHVESPLASSASGAYQPANQKKQDEKLAAAAQDIYSRMLAKQSGKTPKPAKKKAVATGLRLAQEQSSPDRRAMALKIVVLAAVCLLIGYGLVTNFLKPDREFLDAGDRFMKAALYAQAADSYTKHITKHPNDIEGYLKRAEAFTKAKDYVGAAKDYRKALEIDPTQAANVLKYASLLFAAGDFTKAAKAFETVLPNLSGEEAKQAWDQCITCYINTGDQQKAINACDKLFALSGDSELLEIKGELELAMNQFEKGRETLHQAIEKGSRSSSNYQKIYSSYLVQGDRAEALKTLDQAIIRLPREPAFYFMRAKLRYESGQLKEALDSIEQGLTIDQSHWRGYAELARIWVSEFQKTKDEAMLHRALRAVEESKSKARIDGRLSLEEGIVLQVGGQGAKAELKLEEAVRHIDPDDRDDYGFCYLALAQLRRSDYGSAETTLEQALVTEPTSIAHWELKGLLQLESRQEVAAARSFIKSFEVQPSEDKVLLPVDPMGWSRHDLQERMRLAALKAARAEADKIQKYLDQVR